MPPSLFPNHTLPRAPRKITEEERSFEAYRTLRVARAKRQHEGARKARAAKVSTRCQFLHHKALTRSSRKEEEEAAKKK